MLSKRAITTKVSKPHMLEEDELKSIDQKTQFIVYGYVRDGGMMLGMRSVEEDPAAHVLSRIPHIVLSYYHDKFIVHTNVLYTSWSDLSHFCTPSEVDDLQQFQDKLCELGFNKKRLPKYEMLRYYFGTTKDMTRALAKWHGSIEVYSQYKLADVTRFQTKHCLQTLSKSCHFCGYHNEDIGRPSPVFVLDYEHWSWDDFDDLSHVIKAAFYICCWMTDNVDAIDNGIVMMINSRGIRFHHIRRAMTVLRAMQKSLALRTNHVFFLNLPSLAKNSMKLFLKIYPQHIQDKIHICSNVDSLYEKLRHDQIPQIFGGALNVHRDTNNEELQGLGHLLSSYVDIKNFKHLQVDDIDYHLDPADEDESQESHDTVDADVMMQKADGLHDHDSMYLQLE
eukprot:CAMPEP_0202702362 /NCGR_PEP_ID=MMETSP1385-20130828/15362_1 /ASSEMBLY_ACC=CAM_ASM_000861 /TAXON_ID=933848 /ORGANISM="Elphidium margaritaceum" /LENGTH=393 /DNA_ID=CAMNT_0049359999 /DNA_START=35 /DNA_END=1216 /DNA_ORIENTATION=+